MKPQLLLAVLSLGLAASCMTYRLEPVARDGTEILRNRSEVGVSAKTGAADLTVTARWTGELAFTVTVKNTGTRTLHLDSDQFRLSAGDNFGWSQADLVTSAAYYAREEQRVGAGTALMVVGALVAATAPPPSHTTTTVIGTGNGSVVIVSRNRTWYDQDEARWRAQRNAEAVERTARGGRERLQWLKDHLFYQVDLEPGQSYEGLVYAGAGRQSRYKLVIPVDGKDLTFEFRLVKERAFP